MAKQKAEITYKIVEHIGVFGTTPAGWTKELNIVSWNDGEPRYDIRDWSTDHTKMSKGITLSHEHIVALKKLMEDNIV